MKIYYLLIGLSILTGCNSKSRFSVPATELTLTLRSDTITPDTVRIAEEIKSLIRLTDKHMDIRDENYAIESAIKGDSLLTLSITPKIRPDHQSNIKQVLSAVAASPSTLPASDLKIKITETDPELLKLLKLEKDGEFPLQPDLSKAGWAYTEKEKTERAMQTIPTVHVTTYLRYKLKKEAATLNYTNQYDVHRLHGNKGGASEIIARAFNQMDPSEVSYRITSGSPDVNKLWDSLRANHRLQINKEYIQLAWKEMDFDYITYTSSLSIADTLINASIDKLLTHTEPHLFHLLIAPSLSRTIDGYRFE